MTIKITGASQRVNKLGDNVWEAVYICHQCGNQFAYIDTGAECKTEEEAREKSQLLFDVQQRRFCYRCGYKLTDKESTPENDYIAGLNYEIDKIEKDRFDVIQAIKELRQVNFEQDKHIEKLTKELKQWDDYITEYCELKQEWKERFNRSLQIAIDKKWVELVEVPKEQYELFKP